VLPDGTAVVDRLMQPTITETDQPYAQGHNVLERALTKAGLLSADK
jgi:hypothetical protein